MDNFNTPIQLDELKYRFNEDGEFIELQMDCINPSGDIYLFKFKFIMPFERNKSIEIIHGYQFTSKQKIVFDMRTDELNKFLAQLIGASIDACNLKIATMGKRLGYKMDGLIQTVRITASKN